MAKPRVIYWFRTDLRLHDSPALKAALDLSPEAFWPVWTWDPHYVYRARVGVNRWQYLYVFLVQRLRRTCKHVLLISRYDAHRIDCQNDLSTSITKINPKSKLFLLREAPQTLFPKLFKAWKITHLVFEKDTDAYARDRDAVVMQAAKEAGVEVITRTGRTLWDPDEVVKKNGNKPTMSITQLQAAGKKVGEIPRPIPAPTSLPDPGELNLDFEAQRPEVVPDVNGGYREQADQSYESIAGPKGDFSVPTLAQLGFPEATTPHRGGESHALESLAKLAANEKYMATFEKPNTAPTAFNPQSTTLLSPHLHFGSLSIRQFWWTVQDILSSYKGKPSEPPVSLTGQLLFREMYFAAQASLGHSFSTTIGNPNCRFIPWHLPTLPQPNNTNTNGSYAIDSPQAEEHFQRWKHGQTGFPWIDALMRQLKLTGWIHHLGRHAVACFLTRGGCYISWERGAEVFAEYLIDHEEACNVGNWQWLSCTSFYSQFFRVYSPIAFPQKTDGRGEFVGEFVPELKGLVGGKGIYEPWKAGVGELRKAGVKLVNYQDLETGVDGMRVVAEGTYPRPMFDFAEMRTKCLAGMKEGYKAGLYGNDSRILDGSWKSLGLFSKDGIGCVGDGNGDVKLEGVNDDVKKSGNNHNHNHIGSEDAIYDDGAVEEDENGAAEEGGESKGGDNGVKSKSEQQQKRTSKRKATGGQGQQQGTLDGVFKRAKR